MLALKNKIHIRGSKHSWCFPPSELLPDSTWNQPLHWVHSPQVHHLPLGADQVSAPLTPPSWSGAVVTLLLLSCSSVAVALGGLTLWHAALITRGETSVERHINRKETKRLREQGKVATRQQPRPDDASARWTRFQTAVLTQVFRNPYHHGRLKNWKVLFGVETRRWALLAVTLCIRAPARTRRPRVWPSVALLLLSHWLLRVLLPSGHPPSEDGMVWDCIFTRRDPLAIWPFIPKIIWNVIYSHVFYTYIWIYTFFFLFYSKKKPTTLDSLSVSWPPAQRLHLWQFVALWFKMPRPLRRPFC